MLKKLENQSYNKIVIYKKYASNNKHKLTSKYIKNKYNRKLEFKFFGQFQVLNLVE